MGNPAESGVAPNRKALGEAAGWIFALFVNTLLVRWVQHSLCGLFVAWEVSTVVMSMGRTGFLAGRHES